MMQERVTLMRPSLPALSTRLWFCRVSGCWGDTVGQRSYAV